MVLSAMQTASIECINRHRSDIELTSSNLEGVGPTHSVDVDLYLHRLCCPHCHFVLYLCFWKTSETKNAFRRRRGESSDRSPETCGELEIGHELEDDVGHFFEEVIEAPTAYKSVSTSGYVE